MILLLDRIIVGVFTIKKENRYVLLGSRVRHERLGRDPITSQIEFLNLPFNFFNIPIIYISCRSMGAFVFYLD